MRTKTVIILASAALLLTAFNVFLYVRQEQEIHKAALRDLLVPVRANDVVRISVSDSAGGTATVSREKGPWTVLGESGGPASKQQVEDVMAFISYARPQKSTASYYDLGFDMPEAKLEISTAGQMFNVFFAGKTKDGKHVYVNREGEEEVFEVDAGLCDFLGKKAADFRSHYIFAPEADRALSIRVERDGDTPFELRRTGDGWSIQERFSWPADVEMADKLVKMLSQLKGESFLKSVPDVKTLTGCIKVIMSDDSATYSAVFGTASDGHLVAVSYSGVAPVAMTLPDNFNRDFPALTPMRLRRRELRLLSSLEVSLAGIPEDQRRAIESLGRPVVMATQISDISISNKTGDIQFENRKIIWDGTKPDKFHADADEILKLIESVSELRVSEFVTDKTEAECGLENPGAKVVITDMKGRRIVDLRLGNMAGKDECYASLQGRAGIFTIHCDRGGLYWLANRPWYYFHLRPICKFSSKDPVSLTITHEGTTKRYERVGGDEWEMTSPERSKINLPLFYKLPLSEKYGLGKLDAISVVAENKGDLSKFGLDDSSIHVVCEYASPKEFGGRKLTLDMKLSRVFRVRGKKACFGTVKDGKVVYMLPAHLVDVFTTDYRLGKQGSD